MLGGRSPRMVAEAILEPRHYVALARMARLYPDAADLARRYFLGRGDYPHAVRIRTPSGEIAPTMWSHHDVFTVHEIFAREDYRAGPQLRVAVDIGSNIGISALYFLTRGPHARAYLYEPVPRNVQRLGINLRGYEARYELQEVAVAATGGTVGFAIEETGRYGGIGVPGPGREQIEVRCRAIADVLDEVLAREPEIDILKIDTEGAERATVAAIGRERLARIRAICFEAAEPFNPDPDRFALTFAAATCRLDRRS